MFLSGGIDSAILITLMARLNEEPVLAFTAGFDAPGAVDEREQAADDRARRRREARIDRSDRSDGLAASARDRRGDGRPDHGLRHHPVLVPRPACAAGRQGRADRRGRRRDLRRLSALSPGDAALVARRAARCGPAAASTRSRCCAASRSSWRDGMAAAEAALPRAGRSTLAAAQALDMTDWLPHDLLLKLDRCMMAHGGGGTDAVPRSGRDGSRVRLPDAMKMRGEMGKWILRQWLEKNLPAAQPFAPKTGFTVPVGAWIKGQGHAPRSAGGGAAWRRRDRPSRTGSRRCFAISAAGGTASPAGSCCSMRCGTVGTSWACRPPGTCSRRWRRGRG